MSDFHYTLNGVMPVSFLAASGIIILCLLYLSERRFVAERTLLGVVGLMTLGFSGLWFVGNRSDAVSVLGVGAAVIVGICYTPYDSIGQFVAGFGGRRTFHGYSPVTHTGTVRSRSTRKTRKSQNNHTPH